MGPRGAVAHHVVLLLQAGEHGVDGGEGEPAVGQEVAQSGGGEPVALRPQDVHDVALELSQVVQCVSFNQPRVHDRTRSDDGECT